MLALKILHLLNNVFQTIKLLFACPEEFGGQPYVTLITSNLIIGTCQQAFSHSSLAFVGLWDWPFTGTGGCKGWWEIWCHQYQLSGKSLDMNGLRIDNGDLEHMCT